MTATVLMKIGYCRDGAAHLETRHPDGSFPKIYTLAGDSVDDPELADTFQPAGGPVEVSLDGREGFVLRPDWNAAAQKLLESIDVDEGAEADDETLL